MNLEKNPMFEIMGRSLLPISSIGHVCRAWGGDTKIAFTRPSKNCLYMKILNVLSDGVARKIGDIYSVIPGTKLSEYKVWDYHNNKWSNKVFARKWCNHAVLTCCIDGGYVRKLKGHYYEITEKGKCYVTLVNNILDER